MPGVLVVMPGVVPSGALPRLVAAQGRPSPSSLGAAPGAAGAADLVGPGRGIRPGASNGFQGTRESDAFPRPAGFGNKAAPGLPADVLLARTHMGGFPAVSAASSARSSWWNEKAEPGAHGGCGGVSSAVSAPLGGGRKAFYATAPAPRLGATDVEQITGVRLSDTQLQALRLRFQGDGRDRADQLRSEVFGSMVLRPGQWPKVTGGDGSRASSRTGQRTGQSMAPSSLPPAAAKLRSVSRR
ncbi:unnamed protein product [Prorocentrum cordatum]|uniref:Uncharacterized protein n=1 Tax=Prorocentrum cordatum TaxID=2364126 RepID=A0ABN9XXG5_9DINO|nr:unnamed protein product [Polarella glacialis]